jgi:hypothetical protein
MKSSLKYSLGPYPLQEVCVLHACVDFKYQVLERDSFMGLLPPPAPLCPNVITDN